MAFKTKELKPALMSRLQDAMDVDEDERQQTAATAGVQLVGFDIEAKPSSVKGELNKTALVQISTWDNSQCLLAHVHAAMGGTARGAGPATAPFPPGLAALLEDPRVLMVGVGVGDDMRALARDYPGQVSPAGFVDCLVIARFFGYQQGGLKAMAERFGVVVTKPREVQVGPASCCFACHPIGTHVATSCLTLCYMACYDVAGTIWQALGADVELAAAAGRGAGGVRRAGRGAGAVAPPPAARRARAAGPRPAGLGAALCKRRHLVGASGRGARGRRPE